MSLNPAQVEEYSIQHYAINLSVTCDRSVVFPGTPLSCNNKTNWHDITEILLKVVSNSITHKCRNVWLIASFYFILQYVDDKLSKKILEQARLQQEELEEEHGITRYLCVLEEHGITRYLCVLDPQKPVFFCFLYLP